jgi:hypothetical protein
MVFQLFGGQIPQDIRNVSRNVCSGSERDLLVAVTSDNHFPFRDLEVQEPDALSSI